MAEHYYSRVIFGGTISKKDLSTIMEVAGETFDECPSDDDLINSDGHIEIQGFTVYEDVLSSLLCCNRFRKRPKIYRRP